MKFDLEIVGRHQISAFKAERGSVVNYDVVKRFNPVDLIADPYDLCVGLKKAAGAQPEKSRLILVTLISRHNRVSHRFLYSAIHFIIRSNQSTDSCPYCYASRPSKRADQSSEENASNS